jgi:hypothetical protein
MLEDWENQKIDNVFWMIVKSGKRSHARTAGKLEKEELQRIDLITKTGYERTKKEWGF